jgi:hypothetical protein
MEAKLHLYIGGMVKAKLDHAHPLPREAGAWRNERDSVEHRLDIAPGTNPLGREVYMIHPQLC